MGSCSVPKYGDSLRGYAYPIHKRDGFRCVYCGWDGNQWPNWLFLSWDHLLPPGHADRNKCEFIVTACRLCNELHNRTKFDVEGKTPRELIEQKRPLILQRRREYKAFWEQHVATRQYPPEEP